MFTKCFLHLDNRKATVTATKKKIRFQKPMNINYHWWSVYWNLFCLSATNKNVNFSHGEKGDINHFNKKKK